MTLASTFTGSYGSSSAQAAAHNAYGQSSRQIASDSDVEIDLFRRVTTKLIHIMAEYPEGNAPATPENVIAFSDNLRLWDALCVDLMHPDNSLPNDLRGNLLNIGDFVRRHTLGLYSGNGEVGVLVDINKAILAGLSQQKTAKAA